MQYRPLFIKFLNVTGRAQLISLPRRFSCFEWFKLHFSESITHCKHATLVSKFIPYSIIDFELNHYTLQREQNVLPGLLQVRVQYCAKYFQQWLHIPWVRLLFSRRGTELFCWSWKKKGIKFKGEVSQQWSKCAKSWSCPDKWWPPWWQELHTRKRPRCRKFSSCKHSLLKYILLLYISWNIHPCCQNHFRTPIQSFFWVFLTR